MKAFLLFIVLVFITCASIYSQKNEILDTEMIGREKLIEDTRQMTKYIEETHPEPYLNYGGRIPFQRAFQELLLSIPSAGMTRNAFYNKIMPFVAGMGDMHTGLISPVKTESISDGLPVSLKIIEKNLIVTAVPSNEYNFLLGSMLKSVAKIPLSELRKRQKRLRGIENAYGELLFLVMNLRSAEGTSKLIPDWSDSGTIRAEFKLVTEKDTTINFKTTGKSIQKMITYHSTINKPDMESSDVMYNFTDEQKKTALLVISGMERYREACEEWFHDGMEGAEEFTVVAYKRFNKKDPPSDRDSLLRGVPSATETFMSLITDMKNAGTKNLIIDLRNNTGGNSLMKEILVYFLFGKKGLLSINKGYQIIKYSSLYFMNRTADSLECINKNQPIRLVKDDYNFEYERMFRNQRFQLKDVEDMLIQSPTFWNVYSQGLFDQPIITLNNIIVICSPYTTSSGFNMMTALMDNGARVLGTPSAQSGNNFGDIAFFRLNNTGIRGYVSFKQNITFPDDPVKGKCLIPDYLLTYEKFVQYRFDPDAEIIYALEILKEREN